MSWLSGTWDVGERLLLAFWQQRQTICGLLWPLIWARFSLDASHVLEQKDLPQFQRKSFLDDAPINHNTPNWYSYRQTLERMKNIRSRSSHWRATCSFNSKRVIDYRDYMRGKFSGFDIMTFLGDGKCQPVEYVNIRGHASGSGTTAQFWQMLNSYILHINSESTGCGFKPNIGAIPSEDNFGFYSSPNSNFRCTTSDDSTTQWWFGGYLAKAWVKITLPSQHPTFLGS